ncbi:hypothetical protein E2562_008171 [Oryza meyeriana var. granulata]|uniref:Peptidase A1 domain-containing protein n=1 Tax=Oryza meyeriana var. granulata TaxID=110450 RepID=A0A6G1CEK2_9ORYZ|nr:hypothetical protein E2562_008171 [Oryza meyeriana var. granulata]
MWHSENSHIHGDWEEDPSPHGAIYSSLRSLVSPPRKYRGTHQDNGCARSRCQYIVKYGDGSNTTGTYTAPADTLTLSGSGAIKSFQFGCSHAESGFKDQTDGLMGLGGGAQSLVSQTAATYGKSFSYCLPPTSGSSGFLTLGGPSGGGASGFVTTRMLRSRQIPTFYGARLQDIAVGGKKLGLSPSGFSAGSLVDSGAVITRLLPTAYSALSSAFKDGMKQYPNVRS